MHQTVLANLSMLTVDQRFFHGFGFPVWFAKAEPEVVEIIRTKIKVVSFSLILIMNYLASVGSSL